MAQADNVRTIDVVIADNGTISGAIGLEGFTLCRILIPAGWVAADITFQESVDNSTFYDVYPADSDTEYTVQAAASRSIIIPPSNLVGVKWLKVRSGTSGATVQQTGGPLTLVLVVRPV